MAADRAWFPLAYQQVYRKKKVGIWKKVRPIAEAKAIEAQRIEPAVATLASQLHLPASDPDDRVALASLLAMYTVRPDLQNTYTHSGQLDLRGMLTWAGNDLPRNGEGGVALEWLAPNHQRPAASPRMIPGAGLADSSGRLVWGSERVEADHG